MSKLIHYSSPAGTIILRQGLERLAWLQGDGTAYIDTGTKLNYSSVNNLHVICTNDFADKQSAPFIGTSSYQTGFMALYHHINNAIYDRYITGSSYTSYSIPVGNKINFQLLLDYKNLKCSYWLNDSKDLNRTITKGSDTGNIRFFKGDSYAATKCKCYEASISIDSGDLKYFIPVRVKSAITIAGTSYSAGTLGMYDYNNDKLYTNAASSGSFIAGPSCDVLGFPTSEYCLVEWLEGTCGLKLLIAGLTAAANDLFGINVMVANTTEDKNKSFTVTSGSNLFQTNGYSYNTTDKTITNSSSIGGASSNGRWSIPYGSFVLAELSTTICGTKTLNRPLTGNVTSLTIMENSSCRVAYFKVLHKNTVVHHLIPCYRRSDMKPGMYDLVSRTFLTNSGTGEFLLGPSITFGWGEVRNGAGGTEVMPRTTWLKLSNWTNNGATATVEGTTLKIVGLNTGDRRCYVSWAPGSKTYIVSADIKVASGTGTLTFTRSLVDTSPACSCTSTYQHFSRVLTTTGNGTLSIIVSGTATYYILNLSIQEGTVDYSFLHALPHNISSGERDGIKHAAFHFDGTSYMEVDAGSILPANCTKYTIMMWAKVDTANVAALFSQRNAINSTGRCVLYDNTNMYYDDGVRNNFTHGATRNNWNHYAFVRNGSNKYVYINGVLKHTSSASTALIYSPILTIGACQIDGSGVVNLFVGDMADIKVFDTSLDATEIQQEM